LRIILVRCPNFANGGQIFTGGQLFASRGPNSASGGQFIVSGGENSATRDQNFANLGPNLKKINFFSKKLFFQFNYFSPFILIFIIFGI
jgi:hypothetical protein